MNTGLQTAPAHITMKTVQAPHSGGAARVRRPHRTLRSRDHPPPTSHHVGADSPGNRELGSSGAAETPTPLPPLIKLNTN